MLSVGQQQRRFDLWKDRSGSAALGSVMAIVMASVWGFKSCGPVEDDKFPGLCTLNCDGAILLPPGEFSIEPLFDEISSYKYGCGTLAQPLGYDITKPEYLKFKVLNTSSSGGGGGGGGEEGGSSSVDAAANIGGISGDEGAPMPNIRIHASTLGNAFAIDPKLNKVAKPGPAQNGQLSGTLLEYLGIGTPTKEWCSDSCGVFTISLYFFCPALEGETQGYLNLSSGTTATSISIEGENLVELPDDDDNTVGNDNTVDNGNTVDNDNTDDDTDGDGDGDGDDGDG